jgi:hypothetical protein
MYPGGAWAHQLCRTTNASWISMWIHLQLEPRTGLLALREGPGKGMGPASWGWAAPLGSCKCFAMPGLIQELDGRVLGSIFSCAGEVRKRGRPWAFLSWLSLRLQGPWEMGIPLRIQKSERMHYCKDGWIRGAGETLTFKFPDILGPHFSTLMYTLWSFFCI